MDTAMITRVVDDLRHKSAGGVSQDALISQYPKFYKRYPHLFDMATSPTFDAVKFAYTMGLLDNVSRGGRSLEDANVEFGQRMFDDFVAPKIGGGQTPLAFVPPPITP